MSFTIPLRQSLIALSIAGVVFSASLLFLPKHGRSSQAGQNLNQGALVESVRPDTVPKQLVPGLPIRLKIPAINVDAAIDYVGLTSGGAMDVPKGPASVAWFDLGPRPGAKGNAVMAGHFGWKNNTPAAFDNLHKLLVGDTVYVYDENEATLMFTVRELRTYSRNQDAADVFVANDGVAHLNLITCKGIWNKALQSYSNRLVVFTDAVVQ